MNEMYIICAVFIVVFLEVLFIWMAAKPRIGSIELPERRAGRMGEMMATSVIQEILYDDDILLTNVSIKVDKKQTELDNVIINGNGVFIIEVKNYSGDLYGGEDDYEWIKNKMTPGGAFYQKTVKNPIKQVKRQVYILSKYLKNNGVNIWVEGFVFFVRNNCPIESSYVLRTQSDMDETIHQASSNTVSDETQERIRELLQ